MAPRKANMKLQAIWDPTFDRDEGVVFTRNPRVSDQSHGTSLRNTSPAVKGHFVPAGSEFIIPEEISHRFSGDTFQKTVLGQCADGPN
ncbi:hypothetical protein NC652_000825 [Populus alba x Populus x berolinensis]|nr:hypothetical protein NC652_000825 [Populus alba x Populus x berolinensis]